METMRTHRPSHALRLLFLGFFTLGGNAFMSVSLLLPHGPLEQVRCCCLASAARDHRFRAALSSLQRDVDMGRSSPGGCSGKSLGGGSEGVGPDGPSQNFTLNLGKAMETLSEDVPHMFEHPPDLDIFCPNLILKDPMGELCRGKRLYGALHTSLRVLSAITGVRPRVAITSINYDKNRREMELKFLMRTGVGGFSSKGTSEISAISVYRFTEEGKIFEHRLDNRIKRDLWEYSQSWMGVLASDRPPAPPSSIVSH